MNCKICHSESINFSNSRILGKYDVDFFKCSYCGFIQTEEPYWIDESYLNPINRCDVGLVSRNIVYSKITKILIIAFFNTNAKFIDYGGGYGLFVRLMRDAGFDFYHYDNHCENIFAKNFESIKNTQYELLTAFEVFEHLVSPINEIQKMLMYSHNIFFTTELVPKNTPNPEQWWYYGLDHGQHVSFYTLKSLSIIAEKLSLNLYSNGKSIHLLTASKVSALLFNMISRHKVAALLNTITPRKSLIPDDYKKITGKALS